ncbi:MAG: DUF2169 domain-containing protein [Myxococcota bacterium]
MLVVKDTPLEVGWLRWSIKPPTPSLVLVVKGSFSIAPRGPATFPEEQELLTGDVYDDGDPLRSLVYDSDFAILKPRAETFLVGTCHAPRGQRVSTAVVSFRLGAIQKRLAILGDRYWKKGVLGGVTDPVPFDQMPLRWERSFGGPGYKLNPVGRGIARDPIDAEGRVPLPNIELPQTLLRKPSERPEPAGAAPIAKTWDSRLRYGGRYDIRWRTTRFPYFPSNFDYSYFNAAPRDQQIVGYFRGDERIELSGLHPDHQHVRSQLPGIKARTFLARERGSALIEVPLVLDTVVLDAEAMEVRCVWRGNREVPGFSEETFADIFVCHEPLGTDRGIRDYEADYHAALQRMAAEQAAFEAVPMPTEKL